MKILKYISLFFLLGSMTGCQKSDIMRYEQRAGVNFTIYNSTYSFAYNREDDSVVLQLPVTITGLRTDYNREFVVSLPDVDTLTTAEDNQYRIGKGVVKAGEGIGYFDMTIYNDERLNDSVYCVALRVQLTQDFPENRLDRGILKVFFTAKMVAPDNWTYLNLGTFSTAWWLFILEVTDGNRLPYWGGYPNPDPEKWPMSKGELAAWRMQIKKALAEYERKNGPLYHDDGEEKGEVVKIPE